MLHNCIQVCIFTLSCPTSFDYSSLSSHNVLHCTRCIATKCNASISEVLLMMGVQSEPWNQTEKNTNFFAEIPGTWCRTKAEIFPYKGKSYTFSPLVLAALVFYNAPSAFQVSSWLSITLVWLAIVTAWAEAKYSGWTAWYTINFLATLLVHFSFTWD